MTRQITASFTLSTLAALMLAACSPAEQKAAEPAAACFGYASSSGCTYW